MKFANIPLYISITLLLFISCSSEKSYKSQKDNFVGNEKEFHSLKFFVDSILSEDMMIVITLNELNSNQFSLSVGVPDSVSNGMRFPLKVWENVDSNDKRLNEILKAINWQQSDLTYVISTLKDLSCIGLASLDKTKPLSGFEFIYGYGQHGQSYSYILFGTEKGELVRDQLNKKEGVSFYNDSVMFKTTY